MDKTSCLRSSSWVFQTLMTTRMSSTMETWRRKQRQTISRWVLANNMLSEVDWPSTGPECCFIHSLVCFFQAIGITVLWYALSLWLTHAHTCTTACYNARFLPLSCCKERILSRLPMSFVFYLSSTCWKKYGKQFRFLLVPV